MQASLDIPETLINELILETGERNKTKIIKIALEEFLEKLKRKKLKRLRGKIDLDLNLAKYREQDMI